MSLLRWKTKKSLKMAMTRTVLKSIWRDLAGMPPETGSMLGTSTDDHCITHFYFDHSAHTTGGTYSPDNDLLNRLLDEEWNPAGVSLAGFCHSHPWGCAKISASDIAYAEKILACNPHLDQLFLPIVMVEDAARFEIVPYIAVKDGKQIHIERAELVVVDDVPVAEDVPVLAETAEVATPLVVEAPLPVATAPMTTTAAAAAAAMPAVAAEVQPADQPIMICQPLLVPTVTFGVDGPSLATTIQRVKTAYDLARMNISRMIVPGVGGSVSSIEHMGRSFVAEFVLIDPDTVCEANLATQHYRRADIGRPKVECLAERIRDINPQAVVIALQRRLEDITDAEFEKLAFAPLRTWNVLAKNMSGIPDLNVPVQVEIKPATTLLCGFTDSFAAQARINRLGLHFGLPTLCAQVYEQGRAAEITFTHPDVTPACHRCILASRYRAYLEQGFQNTVTADGCPLYATSRLNSLNTAIALAVLHHGTNHPRWGSLLQRIGNRNLVQIRLDPDAPLPVFDRVFGGGDQDRILFDETVWLPQEPEISTDGSAACPECGGTGNLRTAKGTFHDTRLMPK